MRLFFFFFLKANRKIKLLCGKQTHNATQSSENHLNNFLLLLLPKLNINKHIQTEFTLQRTSFSRRQTTSSPPTFAHSNIAFLEPYIFFFLHNSLMYLYVCKFVFCFGGAAVELTDNTTKQKESAKNDRSIRTAIYIVIHSRIV